MIEIVEHPTNSVIRERNKAHLKNHENAEPLITDQLLILADGHEVGWLNNHPLKKPGVAMMIRVDEETIADIDAAVVRYLGEPVRIGQRPKPVDEDTDDDDGEEAEGDDDDS